MLMYTVLVYSTSYPTFYYCPYVCYLNCAWLLYMLVKSVFSCLSRFLVYRNKLQCGPEHIPLSHKSKLWLRDTNNLWHFDLQVKKLLQTFEECGAEFGFKSKKQHLLCNLHDLLPLKCILLCTNYT